MPHCKKNMLSFFLTTKCNLRCIYCYNANERNNVPEKTLSFEVAKAGIDYFFSSSASRHIRFYGPGEPTLEFDLMRKIVDYARSIDNSVTVELQTNGIFNARVRNWIKDNVNIIWVSFDGPPEIQNANRPTISGKASSSIIESNVIYLINNSLDRNLMVGARVTVTNATISMQMRMVDYFMDLGIRYIWNDPIFPSVENQPVNVINTKHCEEFLFDQYVLHYAKAYWYAKSQGVFYGSFLTCNFDGQSNISCRACIPVPHLTPDGYISACDMVVLGENAHHMDCFIYGKWDENTKVFVFDNEKVFRLQSRTYENMIHCQHCKARDYCGGYCLGEIVNETGNLLGQKPKVCKAILELLNLIGPSPNNYKYLHP